MDQTIEMQATVAYSKRLCEAVLDRPVNVVVVRKAGIHLAACWVNRGWEMHFNLQRLGHRFFKAVASGDTESCNDLLIHEMGHFYESDHLSTGYYKALTKLGARMGNLALTKPQLLEGG